MAAARGRWQPRAVLQGGGGRTGRICLRHGVHPSRVPAAQRISLRRILGLSAGGALRADHPPRPPARVPRSCRRRAPGRAGGDPRLGAGSFSDRRARAGTLRRHGALRARRPEGRVPPGLEHPDLQLRPARGLQLSDLERALLARGIPRRRAAGGCGGLDALPRLFPQRRRMGAQHPRRAREPTKPSPCCNA
jgi:hypothetical protein